MISSQVVAAQILQSRSLVTTSLALAGGPGPAPAPRYQNLHGAVSSVLRATR